MDFHILDFVLLTLCIVNVSNTMEVDPIQQFRDQTLLRQQVKTNKPTTVDVDDYLAQDKFSFNHYLDGMPQRPTTQAWWAKQETSTLQPIQAWSVTSSNNTTIKNMARQFVPLDSLKNMSLEDLLKVVSDADTFNKTVMNNIISMYGYANMDEYHNVLEGMLSYIRGLTSDRIEKQTSNTLTTIISDSVKQRPTPFPNMAEANIIRALTPRFLSSPPTTTTPEESTTTVEVPKTFPIIKIQPSALDLIQNTLPGGAEEETPRPSNLIDGIISTEKPTTIHPILIKAKETMKQMNNGYCTAFFHQLFVIISNKNYNDTQELIRALILSVDKAEQTGRFASMYNLESLLMNFIQNLGGYQPDELAGLAMYLNTLLSQRDRLLTEDSNYVLGKIDALYNREEGTDLLNILPYIHDYPHTNMTADEITEELINRVFVPYSKSAGPGVINLIRAALEKKLIYRRHNGNRDSNNYFDVKQFKIKAPIGKISIGYSDLWKREKKSLSQTISKNAITKRFSLRLFLTKTTTQQKNEINYPKKNDKYFSYSLNRTLSNKTIAQFRGRKHNKYIGIPIETEREFLPQVETDSENKSGSKSKSESKSGSRHKHKIHKSKRKSRGKRKHKHSGKVKNKHISSETDGSRSGRRSRITHQSSSKSRSDHESSSSSRLTRELRHKVRKHLKLKHPKLYKKYKKRHKKHKQKYKRRYNHINLPYHQNDDDQNNNPNDNQLLQRRFRIVNTRDSYFTLPSNLGEKLSKYLTPKYDFTYRKIPQANLTRLNFRRNFEDNNLFKESSYSDYEEDLKFNLQDAIRHPHPFVLNDTEHLRGDGDIQNGRRRGLGNKTILDESSYSEDEGILKNNLYKVFINKN